MNYITLFFAFFFLIFAYALGVFSGGGKIGDNKIFNITVEINGELLDPESLDPLLFLFQKLP